METCYILAAAADVATVAGLLEVGHRGGFSNSLGVEVSFLCVLHNYTLTYYHSFISQIFIDRAKNKANDDPALE